jgi:glucokinase
MKQLAVGVDIGGTKIAFVVINQQGEVLARSRIATEPEAGSAVVIKRIAEAIQEIVQPFTEPIVGVGVGSPGLVDSEAGVIRDAVNLGWREVAFVQDLQQAFHQPWPVWIENDVMALSIGEKIFGAVQPYRDFAYVALGTGLGSAAILGQGVGLPMRRLSMEIGHLSVVPNNKRCNCGQLGCLETVVSGRGMATSLELYRGDFPDSLLAQSTQPSTEAIISWAGQGDPLALKIVGEVRHWLGHGLLWLTACLSPQAIVIGGGMGQALLPLVLDDLQSQLGQHPILKSPVLVAAHLTETAVGAASMAFL